MREAWALVRVVNRGRTLTTEELRTNPIAIHFGGRHVLGTHLVPVESTRTRQLPQALPSLELDLGDLPVSRGRSIGLLVVLSERTDTSTPPDIHTTGCVERPSGGIAVDRAELITTAFTLAALGASLTLFIRSF